MAFGEGRYKGWDVAVQPDNRILVSGFSVLDNQYKHATLFRLNTDGTLDSSFGIGGLVIGKAFDGGGRSLVLQPDGGILAAGSTFGVTRYDRNGHLDINFGNHGKASTAFDGSDYLRDIALQPDGKIVLAGLTRTIFAITRFDAGGNLDLSFNGTGMVTTDFGPSSYLAEGNDGANSVMVQADGKILAAGSVRAGEQASDFALIRYASNSELDSTFGKNGQLTTSLSYRDYGYGIALQPDGKILVAGTSGDFALARYYPDGSLDNSFDGDGKAVTSFFPSSSYAQSVLVQPDGKILVGGFTLIKDNSINDYLYDFALVRYKPDGGLDASFGDKGKVVTDFGSNDDRAYGMALQSDGRIILSGWSGNAIALVRYNQDGSLDDSFVGSSSNAVYYPQIGNTVILNGGINLHDSELDAMDDYNGATLTLRRHGGSNSNDNFTGTGTLSFKNNTVNLGNIGVGSFTQINGELSITFGPYVTAAQADAVAQQIAHTSLSGAPSTEIKIDWIFSDGNTGQQGSGGMLSAQTYTLVSFTPNVAPMANAGASQTVGRGALVSLNGNDSIDPDNGPESLTYSWTLLSGPANVKLNQNSSPKPSFTPVVAGTYTFGLVVNDGLSDSSMAKVEIVVGDTASTPNSVPIANPGTPQTVTINAAVTLDGSFSSDPDHGPKPLTYVWTQVSGPTVTLNGANTAQASFTPSQPGEYAFKLTVSDGTANTSATVTVTAQDSTSTVFPYLGATGTFQNRFNPSVSLSVDGNGLYALEDAGNGYVRLKNKNADKYLNIQNGSLQSTPIQSGWWSAQWKPKLGDAGFYFLENRWIPNQYINIENGTLQAGAIKSNWDSAQWKFVPQSADQNLADLSLSLTVDEVNKTSGYLVTYTVKVRNNGPSEASQLTVAMGSGSYPPIEKLAVGAEISLPFIIWYEKPGTVLAKATVRTDQPDPNPADNSAAISITFAPPLPENRSYTFKPEDFGFSATVASAPTQLDTRLSGAALLDTIKQRLLGHLAEPYRVWTRRRVPLAEPTPVPCVNNDTSPLEPGIRIVTLPAEGQLKRSDKAIARGEAVTLSDIQKGLLTYDGPGSGKLTGDWLQKFTLQTATGNRQPYSDPATYVLTLTPVGKAVQRSDDNNTNKLIGTKESDLLRGGDGDDKLDGRSGNDRLFGESGNDRLLGGAGLDNLSGGTGADILSGQDGADELVGGPGNDTMDGGTGKNIFRYLSNQPSSDDLESGGHDQITTIKNDVIAFNGESWATFRMNRAALDERLGQRLPKVIGPASNIAFDGKRLLIDLNGDGIFAPDRDFQVDIKGQVKRVVVDREGRLLLN